MEPNDSLAAHLLPKLPERTTAIPKVTYCWLWVKNIPAKDMTFRGDSAELAGRGRPRLRFSPPEMAASDAWRRRPVGLGHAASQENRLKLFAAAGAWQRTCLFRTGSDTRSLCPDVSRTVVGVQLLGGHSPDPQQERHRHPSGHRIRLSHASFQANCSEDGLISGQKSAAPAAL